MRIANLAGRLVLVDADGLAVDVAKASAGRFGPDVASMYDDFATFADWAATAQLPSGVAFDATDLGAPSPAPRQVFGIGLNYADHSREAGFADIDAPAPLVFAKFPSCVTGPVTTVDLPDGHVDWEVELVAVIGRHAHRVAAADAWAHVAGLTVGQDLSERVLQMLGQAPQFGLGKSFPGFAPTGPWLVTPDEFADPDDLELSCAINGEQVQHARSSQMLHPIPVLVEYLSAVVPLLPGDLIFTGTPAGVGLGRTPPRWLQDGDILTSNVRGIGTLEQTCRTRQRFPG